MSLQSALIFLGIIVIVGIYFASVWREKYAHFFPGKQKPAVKSAPSSRRNYAERRDLDSLSPLSDSQDDYAVNRDAVSLQEGVQELPPKVISGDEMLGYPLQGGGLNERREVVIDGWKQPNMPVGDPSLTKASLPPLDIGGRGDSSLNAVDGDRPGQEKSKWQLDDIEAINGPVSESIDDYHTESTSEVDVTEFEYTATEGFEKISQIDYWVKISGERDVGRESVLGIYRDSISVVTKKSNIYGLRLPEKIWCDLEQESEEARFGDLVVTVQLADKFGPISESEMTRFSVLVSNLSEGTGRGFSFMAPIESAMEQANAIDSFVRYFDSVFIVNIKPRESAYFDGAVINRCATQIGLERSRQNYYVRNKPVGKRTVCLYSLANMSDTGEFNFDDVNNQAIRGVTFFIRPTQIRSPGAVFAEMVDTAKAFASRIKGEVTTPNNGDLSSEEVELIRLSIEDVAMKMGQKGILSGSDEAIRIF